MERLLLAPGLYPSLTDPAFYAYNATSGRLCAAIQRLGTVHRLLTLTYPPTGDEQVPCMSMERDAAGCTCHACDVLYCAVHPRALVCVCSLSL